jgi:hypothetical protein
VGYAVVTSAGAGGQVGRPDAGRPPVAVDPRPPDPPPAYDVTHLIRPQGKYLGVAIDGTPRDMTKIYEFADRIGKQPNLITIYESFTDNFAAAEVRRTYQYGALPIVRWEPFNATLADIAAGKHDRYVTTFATAVRTLNLPIALTFAHEMNGDWYPWSRKTNRPEDYVAAWRHLHAVFAAVGATNVIWTWTPNVINPMPNIRLRPFYPGNAYVDWVGIDGYHTYQEQATFRGLFEPTMKEIRQFTQKSFLIVETAAEPGPRRPQQIAGLFSGVAARPDVLGLVWFNNNGTGQWNIDGDLMSVTAFRTHALDARYGFTVR